MRILLSLLVSSSLVFFTLPAFAGKYNSILDIGDRMPAFNGLPTTAGKTLSSADITEDIVVMVSLANHCPWVRGMDKDLVKLSREFKNQSVHIIGLSMNHREDDRLEAMKQHAIKYGYDFTYAYDESQQLGRALGATRTPEYFVFDKNRELSYMGLLYDSPAKVNFDGSVKHINGEPKEFYVRDAITALLNGKEVAIKETRAHGCSVKYVN